MMQNNQIQRNKELNNTELQVLRNLPQYLSLNKHQFILYNLVDKESNSGLFKNQRLLVLNIKEESLFYLSKVPNGLIPFVNEGEVNGLVAKQKLCYHQIFSENVSKLVCKQLEDKNGIEIKLDRKDKKIEWIFYFKNRDIMKEWYKHINFLYTKNRQEINQTYHGAPIMNINYLPKQTQQDNNKNNTIITQTLNQQQIVKDQESKIKDKTFQQNNQFHPRQSKSKYQTNDLIKQPSNQELHLLKQEPQDVSINQTIQVKQKVSQYQQFSERTPINSYIKQEKRKNIYDTVPEVKNQQTDSIYYNKSFQKEGYRSKSNTMKQTSNQLNFRQNYQFDQRASKGNILAKSNQSELEQKQQQNSIIKQSLYDNQLSKSRSTIKSGSIRKNKPQIMKQYQKHPLQSNKYSSYINRSNQQPNPMAYSSVNSNKDDYKIQIQEQSHTEWNQVYYTRNGNKLNTYFSFINQCLQFVKEFIDELPIRKPLAEMMKIKDYYLIKNNGIQYKIAFDSSQQDSLIYQLAEDTPIVSKHFNIYEMLKQQFTIKKQQFQKHKKQFPALIAIMDYKGLSVLCKAIDRVEIQREQQQKYTASTQNKQNNYEEAILNRMENMQLHITSSNDFTSFMRRYNICSLNWSYLYNNCQVKIFKKIFLNQMFSQIFYSILRSELCHIYNSFPLSEFETIGIELINDIILDCIIMMINRLLGKQKQADTLWDIIIKQCQQRYQIKQKRQNLLTGYLLNGILNKIGLKVKDNVKLSNVLLGSDSSIIDKSNFHQFSVVVNCLDYSQMSTNQLLIANNLDSKSTVQTNQQLISLLKARVEPIPVQIDFYKNAVNLKLSKTITFPSPSPSQGNDIYNIMQIDRPSVQHYETSISAIKWSLLNNELNKASDISFIKIQQILFWIGRIPIISRFLQTMADHLLQNGQYNSGIQRLNRSIDNLIEIYGQLGLPVLQRRMKLADVFLDVNRKQDSLKQLYESKRICQLNRFTESEIYIQIAIKISKLTLCLSKYNQSINNSLQALKNLQKKSQTEQSFEQNTNASQFLTISQLLLRSFELTNRREELFQIGNLCVDRCKNIDSLNIYKRMFKIFIFPYLKRLNLKEAQYLLAIVQQLQMIYLMNGYTQRFLYDCIKQKNMLQQLDQRIYSYFKNIVSLYQQIIKRNIIGSFNQRYTLFLKQAIIRNQPLTCVIDLFLMTNLIGVSFIQAFLKDVYYS